MTLTVIIRDDSPMIHCGDSPSYRTVRLILTEQQKSLLKTEGLESISRAILEKEAISTVRAES